MEQNQSDYNQKLLGMKHTPYNQHTVYPEDIECVVQAKNGKGAIYVGNLEASQSLKTLKKHGIKAVLTAAKSIFLNHPKQHIPHYLYVPGEDHQRFDLSIYFDKSADFIAQVLEETNVLVHCMAGISRSVSLVIAYLMKYQNLGFREALESVKRKRRIINPNRGFIKQLEQYQRKTKQSTQYMRRSMGNMEKAYPQALSPKKYNRYEPYESKKRSYMSSSFYQKPQSSLLSQSTVKYRAQADDPSGGNTPNKILNTKYNIEHSSSKNTRYTSYTDLNKQLDKKIDDIRKKYMETTELLESNNYREDLNSSSKYQSRQNRSKPYFLDQSKKYIHDLNPYKDRKDHGYRYQFKDTSPNPLANLSANTYQPKLSKNHSTIEPYSQKYLRSSLKSNYTKSNLKKMVSFDCGYDY